MRWSLRCRLVHPLEFAIRWAGANGIPSVASAECARIAPKRCVAPVASRHHAGPAVGIAFSIDLNAFTLVATIRREEPRPKRSRRTMGVGGREERQTADERRQNYAHARHLPTKKKRNGERRPKWGEKAKTGREGKNAEKWRKWGGSEGESGGRKSAGFSSSI